ncbi:integrase core domain protein (plasmid) [Antarctobacter heliothermus]|uniref:Integrase core domain protein n=1 Tax=Antarctobacter heliothermus TaxID=74033 RepID=A0A222EAY8_9RHOB|nr:integrase core domain protein [Antarctobacter heliothermus]
MRALPKARLPSPARVATSTEVFHHLCSAGVFQPRHLRGAVLGLVLTEQPDKADGGYDAVRRYAASWSKEEQEASAAAYVPLSFDPGETYQFDWSHEIVVIDGATTTVKVAHVRLCHSRMLFVRAYPRETQEMVIDAHDKAFAFFRGACARGI